MLNSLIDNYTSPQGEESTALISDGLYNYHFAADPEGTIFGDYYYMEAIARLIKPDVRLGW